jgi:hypothetical protein
MIITSGTTVDTSNATTMEAAGLRAFGRADRPIVQNLGPGTLYLGTSVTNLTSVGLQLPVNAVYELPATLMEGAGQIWLAASGGNCDVRIINVG